MTIPAPIPTPTPSLRVVHAAERFVVVDKPAGLLSVPGKGPEHADCVASRVRALFPHATGPLTVHRLDMATSGLIVLALDPGAHRDLSRQFEERRVSKRYLAVLAGDVPADTGEIHLPMRLDVDRRPHQIVDFVHGKPAHTRYRVLERRQTPQGSRTSVEFEPITGRSHQLRVHAAEGLRAPILGDSLYGDAASAPRLMLHAWWLEFEAPGLGGRTAFRSDAPGW